MNIVLVQCPNPVLEVPTAHFPQGLLYVGGALKRARHKVEIIDLRARKRIEAYDIPLAEVVGVTATSGEIHMAKEVAQIARKRGSKTMIGGAHATFMPQDCLEDFDFVIQGEGEKAAVRALRDKLPGRYFDSPTSLNGLFPDWELIGEKGFSRELFPGAGYGQGPLAAGISSSRGCPFHCSYCQSQSRGVRFRPIEDVYDEVEDLKERWGITHFRFYDDCMTLNRKRALDLFSILETLEVKWRGHSRSDLWDDELAEAAKKSGCEEMGFGFEAATDSVLQAVRKGETVAQHKEAVRVCKRNGILCKAFWMVGLPRQGWSAIGDIKRFMQEEKPDKWIVSLHAPYPGSDIYAQPEKYGVTWIDPDFSHYWNFAESPTIAYQDNSKEEIQAQYKDLKEWLEVYFGRS